MDFVKLDRMSAEVLDSLDWHDVSSNRMQRRDSSHKPG